MTLPPDDMPKFKVGDWVVNTDAVSGEFSTLHTNSTGWLMYVSNIGATAIETNRWICISKPKEYLDPKNHEDNLDGKATESVGTYNIERLELAPPEVLVKYGLLPKEEVEINIII